MISIKRIKKIITDFFKSRVFPVAVLLIQKTLHLVELGFASKYCKYVTSLIFGFLASARVVVKAFLSPAIVMLYVAYPHSPEFVKKNCRKLKQAVVLLKKIFVIKPTKGQLSLRIVGRLAFKSLIHQPSRSAVTIGAIALGTGAIVFLMSFGYGLQAIVNERLIQPNSMRLADVQSDSTALSLNTETVEQIKNISGVEDIAAAVSIAGSFSYKNSRMDVVVIGADNRYLEYAHINMTDGKFFSKAAEKKHLGTCLPAEGEGGECQNDLQKLLSDIAKEDSEQQVLGVSQKSEKITIGKKIIDNKIRFRIKDDLFLPVRSSPTLSGEIIGYIKGSILETHGGYEVWGGEYKSVGTEGKYYQGDTGTWYGRWLKASVPLYKETMDTVFDPATEENGTQLQKEGYIPEIDVRVLDDRDVLLERQMKELIEKTKRKVLGEATPSAQTATESSNLTSVSLEAQTSTESADLEEFVKKETAKQATVEAKLGFVQVEKKGGKEILLSTKILSALKIKPKSIIGKSIKLEYIVSGGVIKGITGRVISKPVTYKVVGVVQEDKQSLIFAPLADIQSMGITRFGQAKVLAASVDSLPKVRNKIESLGFVTISITDTLAQVDKLFQVMRFLLGSFGLIALVVAIFGMFNTLTVSLLERTREIGVMKTLGTTELDVVRLFLAESLIIGFVGGIFGVILGLGMGQVVNFIMGFFQTAKTVNLFQAPATFVVSIIVLSIIVGFATGLYPAKRAKGISALNALRYE